MLPTIVIEGRAVADSELKVTGTGRKLLNFRVATSDSKKDDAGNWQTTEQLFVNVTLWDDAENYAALIRKGAKVTVVGRIYEREYDKSDGSKGRSLEIKYPMVKVHQDRQQQGGGYQQPAPRPQQAPAADPWAQQQAAGDPWGQQTEAPF